MIFQNSNGGLSLTKRKIHYKFLFTAAALVPLFFAACYVAGFLAQLIGNYHVWSAAGNTPGNGTSPVLPSARITDCYRILFTTANGIRGLGICLILMSILLYLLYQRSKDPESILDEERNLSYSQKGTYGTSGFMTEPELKRVLRLTTDLDHVKGTILGKLDGKAVCLPEETLMNRNVAVYGASGSMKSRAFARNMILQCVRRSESLIINDPKSELYEDMSGYLEDCGYHVKVFNLVNPECSDSWNFVADMEGQELLAQLSSDIIIKNTSNGKADHFWDSSEQNLLKALILYVAVNYPEGSKNMESVYQLLIMSTEEELRAIFSLLPADHPAKAPFSLFLRPSPSVRGDIMQGLGSRLQVFQNRLICQITAHNEIDLVQPGKEKCAIFLITSDQDSTFDFLSALFMNFVFVKLVRYADTYGENGKLPIPVHILADELANTGAILDLPKKISTIRSRNLSISCIFQNIAQMQNRYPNNQWLEIIGNCDTQLFLGCTDELTATFISNRTGEISIDVSSQSKHLSTWQISDHTTDYRETRSLGRRKLLTMDEVLRFPLDQALIILRGQKVLKVEKFDYTLHPDSRKLWKQKARDHVPQWRSTPTSSAENRFYETPAPKSQSQKRSNLGTMSTADAVPAYVPADKNSILS